MTPECCSDDVDSNADSDPAVDDSEASSSDGGEEAMDRLRQVVNLLENCAPNHLQLEYDTMQAKQSRLRQWPLILGNRKKADECKLKDTRPILKLPLYIDTEDKDIERECSSHLKIMIPASNVSVALIYRLGDHEGRVTLESVRKPATVMRTIARQIVLRCGCFVVAAPVALRCKVNHNHHDVSKRKLYLSADRIAESGQQIKRHAYVLDVVIHTRLRCDMESEANSDPPPPSPRFDGGDWSSSSSSSSALRESLLELEVKPLGSPKVEILAPTPVLIDPSISTMDTSHSNFDPQRTIPLVSRNPRSSSAPSSTTIGLMPATPPMRRQRVPLEVVGSLSRYQRRTLAARSTILISASAQVLANRSARGKNPLSKLRGFAQALHSMSGSQDKFNVEVTCSSCKKRSEIVDPKPCHDE
ncbi:BZ3500_MvSof-1268-A1-R1_Chr5-2g07715 [Microbotryum saponariae]|uniref:BZ3500_MvSof-1268-A1-R1_Chr5-2g07715 protein n=1 Tax=Microbotryum saponariae TaxID=289078 RepID=A0A2X0KM18_9BASI|nr:BZ3500_MvSof-1268-A1-R1_Chr5-2g07715 [Microbotryum saponariae]